MSCSANVNCFTIKKRKHRTPPPGRVPIKAPGAMLIMPVPPRPLDGDSTSLKAIDSRETGLVVRVSSYCLACCAGFEPRPSAPGSGRVLSRARNLVRGEGSVGRRGDRRRAALLQTARRYRRRRPSAGPQSPSLVTRRSRAGRLIGVAAVLADRSACLFAI